MKIKLDENLPLALATLLMDFGHDVDTSQDEGLAGHPDDEIWEAAQRESRFLITQDLDFSDLRRFPRGTHSGFLLLRLDSRSQDALVRHVEKIFRQENTAEWSGCLVVATEHKVRVVEPHKPRNS